MALTRSMINQNIRIKPTLNADFTVLHDDLVDFNAGEKPEQVTKGDTSSINGSVPIIVKLNKSVDGATMTINRNSDTYFRLKKIEDILDRCEIIYTDTSSDRGGEEYIYKNAFFRFPATNSGDETVEVEIMASEMQYKSL